MSLVPVCMFSRAMLGVSVFIQWEHECTMDVVDASARLQPKVSQECPDVLQNMIIQ